MNFKFDNFTAMHQYSRIYWRELNLVVGSQMAIVKVLADFNLVVRYGIAIRIYASNLVVVEVDCQTTKFNSLPNFPAIQYISNYWRDINLKFAKSPN